MEKKQSPWNAGEAASESENKKDELKELLQKVKNGEMTIEEFNSIPDREKRRLLEERYGKENMNKGTELYRALNPQTFAEAMLAALIATDSIGKVGHELVKELVIPIIEYVEKQKTPMDRYKSAEDIVKAVTLGVAFAIETSIKEEGKEKALNSLHDDFRDGIRLALPTVKTLVKIAER